MDFVKIKNSLFVFFDLVISLLLAGAGFISDSIPKTVENPALPQNEAMAFVKEMKIGWNLGDALCSWLPGVTGLETETCWACPLTTKEVFEAVKAASYNTVRIPVTWGNHMGEAPDYRIEEEWLDRVQEVVDYAYDLGLYVILNTHCEEEYWLIPDNEHKSAVEAQFAALWTQVGERFKDYDNHLLFESMNEPRVKDSLLEWAGGTVSQRKIVNSLNDDFVKLIRSQGGNNPSRYLLIPSYAAARDNVSLNAMTVPDDDKIIVSVHAYYPADFVSRDSWEAKSWGTDKDKYAVDSMLCKIYEKFTKQGIPVVMGEFGAANKNNLASRVEYTSYYVSTAKKYGIICCWWDNEKMTGDEPNGYFGLLDRTTYEWVFPEIVEAMIQAS